VEPAAFTRCFRSFNRCSVARTPVSAISSADSSSSYRSSSMRAPVNTCAMPLPVRARPLRRRWNQASRGASTAGATKGAAATAGGGVTVSPVKTRFRKSSGAAVGSGAGAGAIAGTDALAGAAVGDSTARATSGMRWVSHGEPESGFLRKKLNMKGSDLSKRAGGRGRGVVLHADAHAQWSGQTGAIQARLLFFTIVPATPSPAIKKLHIMAGLAL
jgi:hypothetical protein